MTDDPLETIPEDPTASFNTIQYLNTILTNSPITEGKVINVHDACTIIVATHINVYSPDIFRFNIRLRGIDICDINDRPTRDVIYGMVRDRIVQLKNVSLEKHGNMVADVYLDDIHLNQWLVDNKYAIAIY
jgi:endonuclease YncB( thermonuclease family)